ncbi:MAG: AEC family transporter [Asticcacaulis sp.]
MFDSLSRVLLFFSFVGLGIVLVRLGRLKSEGLDGLSAYFYWLGFPAYLIHAFSHMPAPTVTSLKWLGVYGLGLLLTGCLCFLSVRKSRGTSGDASGVGMAAFISNSAFLGLPIATGLFGTEVRDIGPVFFIADFLILFFIGCAALSMAGGRGAGFAVKQTFRNPTVIGSLTGLAILVSGLTLPPMVDQALDIMGKSSVPVALVALGGMLGLMPVSKLLSLNRLNSIAVTGKLLIAPALVALLMWAFAAPPLVFKTAVLLSACPTAVSVFIQARMYGLWYEGAAISIAQSTLLSLLTLSGLAIILTAF